MDSGGLVCFPEEELLDVDGRADEEVTREGEQNSCENIMLIVVI